MLLFVSAVAAFVDVRQCRELATRQVPVAGNWARLAPTSDYYGGFNLSMPLADIRITTSGAPPGLIAVEYPLPARNMTSNAWSLRATYRISTGAYLGTPLRTSGLGTWHAFGMDWGAPGSLPDMTALRYASGHNATGPVALRRIFGTAMRFGADRCTTPSPNCHYFDWNQTTIDSSGASRMIDFTFAFDGAALYPVRAQADAFVVADPEFVRIAVVGTRPPARMILVGEFSAFTVTGFKLEQADLDCPASATVAPATTGAPVTTTTTTTAAPSTTTAATTAAPSTTTAAATTAAPSTTTTTAATTAAPSTTTTRASIAPTPEETAAPSTRMSTTDTPATTDTTVPETTWVPTPAPLDTAVPGPLEPGPATEAEEATTTPTIVAGVVGGLVGLLAIVCLVSAALRRALCWAPIYTSLPTRMQTCCWLCAAQPVDDPLPQVPEQIYGALPQSREVVYDRVSHYDSPSSVLAE